MKRKEKHRESMGDRNSETNFGVPASNLEILASRIRECAKLVGSGDALAAAAGIPRRTLETYLSGDAEPKALRLAAIAKSARVSLDWLAGLTETMQPASGVAQSRPAYAGRGLVAPLHRDVLFDVLVVVEEQLQGRYLEPEKKAELILLLYEEAEHEGKVDRDKTIRLIKLAL